MRREVVRSGFALSARYALSNEVELDVRQKAREKVILEDEVR